MNYSYTFKRNHIKILDKDVKIVITIKDPDLSFQDDMLYHWNLQVRFYLHRKLKWLPAKLDQTYYSGCTTKECILDNNFDIIGLYKKYCQEYEQCLIEEKQQQIADSQLRQNLKNWDGSYVEEGDENE